MAGSISYRPLGGRPQLRRRHTRRLANGVGYEVPHVRLREGGTISARGGRLGGQRLSPFLRQGVISFIRREATHEVTVNIVDNHRHLPWWGCNLSQGSTDHTARS